MLESFQAKYAAPFAVLGIRTIGERVADIEYLPPGVATLAPLNKLAERACRQIERYLDDPAYVFDLPFDYAGTPFQCRVWRQISAIPPGRTLTYKDVASSAVLVLETAEPPPETVVLKVAHATRLAADRLTFLYAPTQSLAATVQIVSRVLEVALHKANDLGYPLENIVDGIGASPIPAPHPDFLIAMGRTNDAIIYGGLVQLFVKGSAKDAKGLAEKLPSKASRDYGQPFANIFKQFKGDFYAIDPLLFSPAEIIVTAIETGDTFRAGGRDLKMLERSLG